jgi:hypothetical protein
MSDPTRARPLRAIRDSGGRGTTWGVRCRTRWLGGGGVIEEREVI